MISFLEGCEFMVLYKGKSRLIRSAVVVSDDIEYLNCMTTICLQKNKNEDFSATVVSPSNPAIKLIVVCDGMGGGKHGEMASEFVVNSIVYWFNSCDFSCGFPDNIQRIINSQIRKINLNLKRKYKGSGTTLTMTLVGEFETYVVNIGDSRAYSVKNGKLAQLTKDDSIAWKYFYRNGKGRYTKDELRFLTKNYILTECLGTSFFFKINTNLISNNTYDGLLLLSDGVTDIVSDKRMEELLSSTDYSSFLANLLHDSCYGESEFFEDGREESLFEKPTLPGEDNATAALYLKLKK